MQEAYCMFLSDKHRQILLVILNSCKAQAIIPSWSMRYISFQLIIIIIIIILILILILILIIIIIIIIIINDQWICD